MRANFSRLHFQRSWFTRTGPAQTHFTPARRFDSFTSFVDQYVHEILNRKECHLPISQITIRSYTHG
jgi:hypothetical protein